MSTDCTSPQLELQGFTKGLRLVARFDGGAISSDGGAVLLERADWGRGLLERFAACFEDFRDPQRCEHTVLELVRQRVYGLALGYEDLNDHDELRLDPLLILREKPGLEVLVNPDLESLLSGIFF